MLIALPRCSSKYRAMLVIAAWLIRPWPKSRSEKSAIVRSAALRAAGAVLLGKTTTTQFASPLPVGAGVIGVGAIWTLATLFVPMARGVKASFSALTRAGAARAGKAPRTERDLSAGWISVVTLVLVAVLSESSAAFERRPKR